MLGTVPSLAYAIVYLLCIPAFALVYDNLPNHFYHSTIKYEQILNKDEEEILDEIRKTVIATFVQVHGHDDQDFDKWTIRIESLEVWSLKVEGNQVRFSFSVPLALQEDKFNDHPFPAELFNAEADFPLIYTPIARSEDQTYYGTFEKLLTVRALTGSSASMDEALRSGVIKTVFPFESDWITSRGQPIISLHQALLDHLFDYSKGLNGFPSSLSGNYWRMLYLSAVTITTLGYGDIVPITNKSRILISLESILGVVLIGLFLNALAYERK
jgi:hypothetical protein